MGFFSTLFLILLVLKLTNTIIVSWTILFLILLMPIFLFIGFSILFIAIALIAEFSKRY